MNRPTFAEPPCLWERDGSLRDVYVHGTSEADWLALFAVAARYPHRYSFDGALAELLNPQSIFSNREGPHLLSIIVGGVTVNCHFFQPTEIELDIDPREVTSHTIHEQVLLFLEVLAHETKKSLHITAENSPGSQYLTYEPILSTWTVHAPQHVRVA
jgi:hypothetical protein